MIDAHRGAFEYDWRTRINQDRGLAIVGTKRMSWGEALRLTKQLASDPSSRVGSALAGWEHPAAWGDLIAMNTYDLMHQVAWAQGGRKGQKPKPYPRPWGAASKKTITPDASLSHDEIVAALRFAGHDAPVPARPTA